jgi:glycine betaine/proline transport system ATP-binding protein
VLLLDEPFSALDPLLRRALQDELLALRGTTTTVFVTHDVDEAMRLGTRIAVMHEGALVQLATPAELVLRPAPLVAALLSARAA